MKEKFESYKKNETWKLCELPVGAKTVECKWVFKLKNDAPGKVVRHKARLLAMGYTQRYGVDYVDTFCLVIGYTSLKTLFAIGVNEGMPILQINAICAFLQATLEENIYMAQP